MKIQHDVQNIFEKVLKVDVTKETDTTTDKDKNSNFIITQLVCEPYT